MKERFLSLIEKYSNREKYNIKCWDEIYENYSSNSRHYHNLEHLKNMFAELDKVTSQINRLDSLKFSIFYHDIIYNPLKSNNERRSALIFKKRISNTTFDHIDSCMAQIEATKEHMVSDDRDTNFLLDLDLSILGSPSDEYKRYCENIRKEYFLYPESIYRKGRKKVLKHFLKRDSIFKTDFFIKKYEKKARENLDLELRELN